MNVTCNSSSNSVQCVSIYTRPTPTDNIEVSSFYGYCCLFSIFFSLPPSPPLPFSHSLSLALTWSAAHKSFIQQSFLFSLRFFISPFFIHSISKFPMKGPHDNFQSTFLFFRSNRATSGAAPGTLAVHYNCDYKKGKKRAL